MSDASEPATEDTLKALTESIDLAETVIAAASPLSQRAVALVSLVRFAERAKRFVKANSDGVPPFRLLAEILEFRDLARIEQTRIDDLLRQRIPEAENVDVLHIYKIHLAQTEQVAMASLGYVRSDKEDSEESAWWARRGGAIIMETIGLAPLLIRLPDQPGEI